MPTNKVSAAALAGAIVAVGLWITHTDAEPPIVAALTTLVLFVVSYFVKD